MSDPRHPTLSRRKFLHGSAAVAAPVILGRGAALADRADRHVLRVGLVGCGGRGTGAAFQALCAEEGTAVLTAVADVFPERLESCLTNLSSALGEERLDRLQVDEDHRFAGFDAFARLIASDVDVVLLATPPHFRPEHLEACVRAGKHVFCEKPMAVDAPGVRRVLAAAGKAREQGLALVSGFCWRYSLPHRELYARVLHGDLGDLRAVYSTYNASPINTHPRQSGWSDMEWQLRNWHHFVWLSGDHVVEQACHSLDKMSWAMGDAPPLSVTAIGGRSARSGAESGNAYDHFGATFDYADGVKGFHMSRQMARCSNDNSDLVMGTRGNASIGSWASHHVIDGEIPWTFEGESPDMYQQEHDELFASIRAGEPRNDGDWMCVSTMLGIMVRMAAYSGQTITWEQAMASEERLGPDSYRLGWIGHQPVAVPGVTAFH